ncbi:phage head closure protein [Vogesella sp. XCS3]|nr:phage head closure protein [Vogesella sp. XCS3]
MRAGQLKHRITLLTYTTTGRDSMGQPIKGWSENPPIWANVRFISGREFVRADKETAEATASIRIRSRAVTTDMCVRYKGVLYDIRAVLPAASGDFIDLAVAEVKAAP